MKKKYLIYTTAIVILAAILASGCSNIQSPKTQDIEIDVTEDKDTTNEDKDAIIEDIEEDIEEDIKEDSQEDTISLDTEKKPDKNKNQSTSLTKLLPHREGYRWVYDGAVEYGHNMVLKSIEKEKDRIVYTIEGEVDDMSGGESKRDFSLGVTYTLTKDSLVQTVDSEMMMDSEFSEIELIRAPLAKDSKWTQKQNNSKREIVTLESSIDNIEDDGGQKIYTVTYRDKNSKYYERRKIKEGVGVIYFEHLFSYDNEGKEESMTMGYSLNHSYSGYVNNLDINRYLPPLNKEIVYFGLAEYGHKGSFKKVSATSDFAEYEFDAVYNDGSGIDDKFKVQYNIDYIRGTVTERVLSNTRDKQKEVNSKLQPLVVLKTPFEKDNSWNHKVKLDGKSYTVSATIKEVDDKVGRVVVEYRVKGVPGYYDNTYIERRTFQIKQGMIGFNNLLPGDIGIDKKQAKDSKLLEEAIINHMFGYGSAPTE